MLARSPVPGPGVGDESSARTNYAKFIKLISDRQNGQIPAYTLRVYCVACLER